MARFVVVQGWRGRSIADHEVRAISSALTGSVEVIRPRPDLVVMLDRDATWERVVPGNRASVAAGAAVLVSSAADVPEALPRPEELMSPHPARAIGVLPTPFVTVAWDDERCRVFTDVIGSRAVWSSHRPGQIVVASEPHLVLAHPDVPKTPDLGVIAERLSYRPSTGRATVFEGVTLASPGSVLQIDRSGSSSVVPWHSWNLEVDDERSLADWAEEILCTTERVIEREVKQRGAAHSVLHVSGGLDSSALAGVIAAQGSDAQMVALTRSYPGLPCDESAFQDAALRGASFERRSTSPLPVDIDLDLLEPTAASRLPLLRVEPAERHDSLWVGSHGRRSEFTGVGGDELFDAINTTPLEAAVDRRWADAVFGVRSSSPWELLRDHLDFFPARLRRSRVRVRPWIAAALAEDTALAPRWGGGGGGGSREPFCPPRGARGGVGRPATLPSGVPAGRTAPGLGYRWLVVFGSSRVSRAPPGKERD